ncbi:hypothetical protein BKA69DRAFT_7337 [Paraphysoderma sedebokerense]|nr:hypothetical protein BKA69DRAFT_7337 [Paraphysoderma sedebokerense]
MLKARAPYDVYGKDRIIKSLTTMGESVGLHSYHDTSMESGVDVVMLSASIVVIDVEIDSEGSVRRAKVQFASGAPPDPRVDKLLTSHLRGNAIIAFQNDINYLARLDTLTTKFGSKIDFFHNIKTLEQDVLSISKMESEHSSLMDVLKFGHGIPLVNRNRIGLSLAFYGKQEAILGMEWESINLDSEDIPEALMSDLFYRARVSIQESNSPGLFLPSDQKTFLKSQNSDFMITDDSFDSIQTESPLLPTRLQYTGPLRPASDVHVGYVLELDPPVVLPLAAAKEISKKIGLENGFQDGNELMEFPDFVLRTVTEFPESFNVESVVSGASYLQKELPDVETPSAFSRSVEIRFCGLGSLEFSEPGFRYQLKAKVGY